MRISRLSKKAQELKDEQWWNEYIFGLYFAFVLAHRDKIDFKEIEDYEKIDLFLTEEIQLDFAD